MSDLSVFFIPIVAVLVIGIPAFIWGGHTGLSRPLLSLKPFQSRGAGVVDLLPWATLMDDGIIITKDGALLTGYFFRGPDVAASTSGELNHISERINRALAPLGDGWAIWVDAVRMPAASYPPDEASHFEDQVTVRIDAERRRQFLAEGAHFETEQAVFLQYTPPLRQKTKLLDWMYTHSLPVSSRQIEDFRRALTAIEDTLGDALDLRRMHGFDYEDEHGQTHHQDELVNYLHFCVSGCEGGLNIPTCASHLDAFIGGQELWTGDILKLGETYIACVAIDGLPGESYPAILAQLANQPFAYRASFRFIPLDLVTAEKDLTRYRRKWTQKKRGFFQQIFRIEGGYVNEDAVLMAGQTEAALSEANSGLVNFGYFTAVVVLSGTERAALEDQARILARQLGRLGFATRLETVNTTEAWLGTLPGHVRPNVRRPLIHSLNYADLVPSSAQFTGLVHNPSPLFPAHAPALLHASTGGATPFRLNLHVGDVGHTLIFGPTGAGKSVLLATLAAQFMRYRQARVTVFDKGLSMFALAKAIEATGGKAAHYALADEQGSIGLCPLAFLDTPGDIAWAEEWLATCYELQTREPPSPSQKGEIHRAITGMARTQADESRTLTDFLTTVQDEGIRSALRVYTIDGPLGELLDARVDGLGESCFTVFELDALLTRPDHNAIPVLLTLFRRFEQSLTGAPALLILDEAWVMLGHPVFREKLREWLKTLRKANCAVVLATQSLSDAWRSGLLDVLMESCPTKIFLANTEAQKRGSSDVPGPYDIYTAFGLNEAEIDIIASATPKRDYYYTSPLGRRPFELGLGDFARSFVAVSSREDIAHIQALIANHGTNWPQKWLQTRRNRHALQHAA